MTAQEATLWREAVDALVREWSPQFNTIEHVGRVFKLTQLWPELTQALAHVAKLAPKVSKNPGEYEADGAIISASAYASAERIKHDLGLAEPGDFSRETPRYDGRVIVWPTGLQPQGWQSLDAHGIRKRWYPPRHG